MPKIPAGRGRSWRHGEGPAWSATADAGLLQKAQAGERIRIRYLNSEHSLTMLMVTHQMGFAREISDRVCFFYGGSIAEQGPPEQIFGDPQNDRTRQFLSAVLEAG